jgi:MFS family permease
MPRRALTGLLSAQAVSATGTAMSLVALPWLVFEITGSATALGLVAFAAALPLVVAKALTGPIIDRFGPRRVSILADVAAAAATGAVPVLHLVGGLHLPVLVVLAALVGAARGPGDSAKAALVPAVAEADGTVLERATGLAGAIERLAQMVGPPIAGVLVAALGPVTVVSIDAVSFLAAAVLMVWQTEGAPSAVPEPGYLGQLQAGIGFLRGERLLRSLVAMMALTNLVDAAVVAVLLPLWARESGAGPAGIGLVLGAFGAMGVAGSATAAAAGPRLRRRPTYLTGQLIGGAPRILLLALGAPLPLVVAVWAVAGVAAGFLNPIIGAVTYERIPRPILGRVLTLAGTVTQVGIPIGPVVAGGLVAGLGLAPVALVFGAAYLVTTTLPLRRPEWRQMDVDLIERKPA